jgi:hypothetical protein
MIDDGLMLAIEPMIADVQEYQARRRNGRNGNVIFGPPRE